MQIQPNVMVDGSGNPRITDFGLAPISRSPYSPWSTSDKGECAARWCAPELLAGGQPASKESDIFSFGMVMIEVGSDGLRQRNRLIHPRRFSPGKPRSANAELRPLWQVFWLGKFLIDRIIPHSLTTCGI